MTVVVCGSSNFFGLDVDRLQFPRSVINNSSKFFLLQDPGIRHLSGQAGKGPLLVSFHPFSRRQTENVSAKN